MYDNHDSNRKQLDYKWKDLATAVENLTKDVTAITYDGMSLPVVKLRYGAIDVGDRYLLPGPYTWAATEQLFKPLPIPNLPEIPKAPMLQLPTNQYSSWYIESKKSEPSFLENDLVRRRKTLAQADELRVRIAEKRKAFEHIFAKETVKLQELSQQVLAEDPEALVTLIELANKRNWLSAGLRRDFKAWAEPEAKVVLIE
jgi:hypothetical protein